MNTSRSPGRYGRRPPKRRPAIALAPLLTGAVPDHPGAADYLGALGGGWDMLGNDRWGDCVAVTWANTRRLVTASLAAGTYPGTDMVLALYKTQNPGFPSQDDGMDIQTCLEYLVSTGGPDGVTALGFASVDVTQPDEVKAAIAIFGSVWTGIAVRNQNESEFASSQPWDYDPSSPVAGGHSVITGGYGQPGPGPLGGDERFITWAAETSFTDSFWANEAEEAWVVIWPEHLGSKAFLAGVDMGQFAADYESLTGRPFPGPVPPVDATPDQVLAAVLRGSDRLGQPWVSERHTGYNKVAATAAGQWLISKGL